MGGVWDSNYRPIIGTTEAHPLAGDDDTRYVEDGRLAIRDTTGRNDTYAENHSATGRGRK